ncbi:MAG: hypothetical protein GXO62_02400 [Epsilonproteobacteria bacterium]|nr:hypothetical protein [Campylobacterota bacterium]
MKKLALLCAVSALFAYEINPYFFSVVENYKEYYNGAVIDKDTNSFGDMFGVGVRAKFGCNNWKHTLTFEYASGESTYDGATQDGEKIKTNQDGVEIYNFSYETGYRGFPLSAVVGYRLWKRGKSRYEGDYDEDYKWPYIGAKLSFEYKISSFRMIPQFVYQKAINPQLKVYVGNNPDVALGDTDGYKFELPIYYNVRNYEFFAFYRYQYWHIKESDPSLIVIDNQAMPIFEPESKTKNQYLGVGVNVMF